jgi:hypothetical protein
MTNSTEYYGAEIQDVQVQIAVAVIDPANPTENRIIYAFSQKVLSDTYTKKFTQSASYPIKSSATSAVLTYTPIMLQLGRGGPSISDPVAYVKSLYPSYTVTDSKYDASNLNKVTSMTNISSSPAADLIEVTATFSLVMSVNIIYLTATLT